MKKFFRLLSVYFTFLSLLILISGLAAAYLTPDGITVSDDCTSCFPSFPLSINYDGAARTAGSDGISKAQGELTLFGTVPVKKMEITFSDRPVVTVGGEPFGIRLYTEGLVVSGISAVPVRGGEKNPAADAGISVGDIILSVNGEKLTNNEQLMSAVESSGGNSIMLEYMHEGKTSSAAVVPATDSELHCYRIGLWVKDSLAGIGTVTFSGYPDGTFAGLGHGICDSESGSIMPLSQGDIVRADITSVTKGSGGHPGSLNGFFSSGSAVGTISANAQCGLYGTIDKSYCKGETLPLAFRQEVVRGKAVLRTTISGDTPQDYDIEIEDISYNNANITKNMIIKITDERLLSAAGGIVQGMSGSPVIQNGRLVGAVTHVFINDPSHGYAIFAENMANYNNTLIRKKTK